MSKTQKRNQKDKALTDAVSGQVKRLVIPPGTYLYIVGAVHNKRTVELSALGLTQDLKLIWADGMIGVVAVFNDEEKANKYADNKWNIWRVEVETV